MSNVSAAPQTSYEIYVLEGGSRWILHGRMGPADRKRAIDEAKSLDLQHGIKAVKVVKEVYYPEENASEEVVVYKTRDLKEKPPGGGKKKGKAEPSGIEAMAVAREKERDEEEKDAKIRERRQKKKRDPNAGLGVIEAILRIAIITMLSFGMATIFTIATDFGLIRLKASGVRISQFLYDMTLLSSFILGFTVTLIPLLIRLLKRLGKGGKKPKQDETDLVQEAARHPRQARVEKTLPQSAGSLDIPELEMPEEEDTADEDASEAEPEAEQDPQQEPDPPEPEPELEPEAQATEEALPQTPKLKSAKTKMMMFLGSSIESVKRTKHRLDARNKFGVSLFVAGACSAVAENDQLDPHAHNTVLKDCITALGTAPNMSQTFCDRMGDYLMEPQYKAMYDHGHGSMGTFIQRGQNGATGIEEALDEWNRPVQTSTSKVIAVMFTDIVDSTALTQKLGDHGAQEMVHIHNKIVRSEIVNQLGKEIKHMGDGIMCSFNTPTAAVEAGVAMQKALLRHNNSGHHIQFEIRIGINAGEPIREENDLFGSTVQMAARVCAKAGSWQVYVSDSVKDNSSVKSAGYASAGMFELKGFSEPVEIFEAIWQ